MERMTSEAKGQTPMESSAFVCRSKGFRTAGTSRSFWPSAPRSASARANDIVPRTADRLRVTYRVRTSGRCCEPGADRSVWFSGS